MKTIQATRAAGQAPYVAHAMENGLDVNLWQHYGRFPDLETDEAWAPFPDGYAIVAGTLDCQDEAGTAYSVPFRVRVFLFQNKYTLPMPPSYKYNVMLEPEGEKYQIACQVVHSLKNGEADRIHIRVGCLRSATHKFRIRWRLSGGKELVSGPITLRHFVPRRWAKKRRNRAEVGQEENARTSGFELAFSSCPTSAQFLRFFTAIAHSELAGNRATTQFLSPAQSPPDPELMRRRAKAADPNGRSDPLRRS